jgi:hypothetical protein
MKKILIPILWIAFYLNPLSAQIKKGSWFIGGNGGLYQSTLMDKNGRPTSSLKFENLYLNPELGYFITNHWITGARAGISLLTISFTDINGQAQRQTNHESYSFEPFTRIYFNPQHRFKLFYELSAGSFLSKYNNVVPALDSLRHVTSFVIGSSIGANYFLTDNIAIEGFINYYFYNKTQYARNTIETSFPKFIFNPTFKMRLFLNTKAETMESAQKHFEKGNLTYGIRMNLFLNNNNEFNASTFTPNIGYFLMNNLMIGSEFSLYSASSGTVGVVFMPEVRYYQPLSRLTQGFGRLIYRSTYSVNNQIGTASAFKRQELEIGVGINRFLATNISVQSSLNAAIITDNLSSSIEFKPNLKIGFQYFMNKK